MTPRFSLTYGGKAVSSGELPVTESGNERIYTLAEGVTATLKAEEYPESGAMKWMIVFSNASGHDSDVLADICDCDVLLPLPVPSPKRPGYMPKSGDACVIVYRGMVDGRLYQENDAESALEYAPRTEYLDRAPGRTKTFANVNGRSSDGTLPFFDVTAGGEGFIAAVGWTGSWKAAFTAEEGGIRVKTGLKTARFALKDGETLRTSSILLMPYKAHEDKVNKFRKLMRAHFSVHTGREGLLAFELWGGLTSEEMIRRIDAFGKRGIGFEDVWIDAGWYGTCEHCEDAFSGDWSKHTGEWEVNEKRHPDGLSDVAACAQKYGMRLMLWFEPERAVRGTPVTKAHPDWFLSAGGSDNLLLDYGNPEAFSYMLELLSGYVEKLRLSCLRQDFNMPIDVFFAENDEADRVGIREIRHITGMYALWDALHERFPDLLIDNCSSGGRRIDIETTSRAIPFFRSDYQCAFNENPDVLQCHNAGAANLLPVMGCTHKTPGDDYTARSAYAASYGAAYYNAIFQAFSEEDLAWAKKSADEFRSLRRYFSKDFYNHGSSVFDETAWAVFRYEDPADASGVILAFRREKSPFDRMRVTVCGIPGALYRYTDTDAGTVYRGGGSVEIVIAKKRGSCVIRYERIQ